MARKKTDKCIKVIRDAVDSKISKEQADELIKRIREQVEDPTQEGLLAADKTIGGPEDIALAKQLAEHLKVENAVKRRNTLLALTKEADVLNHVFNVSKASNFAHAVQELFEGSTTFKAGVDQRQVDLATQYINAIEVGLNDIDPTYYRILRSRSLDDPISKELAAMSHTTETPRSVSGNKQAYDIAGVIHKIRIEAVARTNRAGGSIGLAKNRPFGMHHDPHRIRLAGKDGLLRKVQEKKDLLGDREKASFKQWAADVEPLLDWDEMRVDTKKKEEFLRSVHANLYRQDFGSREFKIRGESREVSETQALLGEFTGVGSLARKVSKSRELIFRDSESFMQYNRKYSNVNSVLEGVTRDLHRMADATAIMEVLGPNPERLIERVKQKVVKQSKTKQAGLKATEAFNGSNFQAAFDQVMGKLNVSPNTSGAHFFTAFRRAWSGWNIVTKQGGTLRSSIPDIATGLANGRFIGLSSIKLLQNQIETIPKRFLEMWGGLPAEQKRMFLLMRVGHESAISNIAARYTDVTGPSTLMYKWANKMMTINGMNAWNDGTKMAFNITLGADLGTQANRSFSALDPRMIEAMRLRGIGEAEWNLYRQSVVMHDDVPYIVPGELNLGDRAIVRYMAEKGIKNTPNNRARARDELTTRIGVLFSDEANHATPTPGSREMRISNLNTREGTAAGILTRMFMQFKRHPITVMNKLIARGAKGRGAKGVNDWLLNPNKGAFWTASLIASTTIMGIMVNAIRDMEKGRKPRSLLDEDGPFGVNKDVWIDGFLRGGGGGIYADILMQEYDRGYKSPQAAFMGPTIGTLSDIVVTTTNAEQASDLAKSSERLIRGNIPFANLFYLRPVLDYLIFWNMQEMLNPGSLDRMERKVERDKNQTFWLRPSQNVGRALEGELPTLE